MEVKFRESMYCDSFPLIKFAVALQQLTCEGITFWNFYVLPASSDHKDKVFVDSWLPGWFSRRTQDQGRCLPRNLPPLGHHRTDWFPGEVTHPEIQALVHDDISVLLAKLKCDLAAKKDSSQNSCIDPTACRKLFPLNFPGACSKDLLLGNYMHITGAETRSNLPAACSNLTLFSLASPLIS